MTPFNLSKTEFVAYLECPLKFYLIKSANQGETFGPRGERDYSSFPAAIKEGMKWHAWFERFHENYYARISAGKPPLVTWDSKEARICKLFYEHELKRFQEEPEYWHPLATELYLQTDSFRGTIDRIDQLNARGDCCIIEYKKEKGLFDEQELLFYATLLAEIDKETIGLQAETRVKAIGMYYYSTGEFLTREVTEEEIRTFRSYLVNLKVEMLQRNWRKKEHCDEQPKQCLYYPICKRIPEELLFIKRS